MMKTKGSRPGDCSTRTAAETAAFGEAAISKTDSTTPAAARQIKVADYLMHGVENAIPRRHLRQITGFSDRDLRRRIQAERLAGVPILSDNKCGYYLPGDDGERAEFIRSMRGRGREIQAVAAAVEEAENG